ncbi:hypothetical protein IFM89_022495 [Coptis chinensis]|uniref:DUF4283 domain-containing protein n=1 Tax=Coptis chinensis TaxID=261450 RepID=A0A835M0L9_9MAGN|nr:hypothetical protein IFM89_022495 [Coptis chinensis]
MAGRVFMIRPWTEELEAQRRNMTTLPILVKIWDIPKQMWTKKGISFIASRIGKPHYWDEATRKKQRLNYAKVCIEYLWIPSTCSPCKKVGHKDTTCSSIKVPRTSALTNRNVNAMRNEGQVQPRQQHSTWVRRLATATTVTPINGRITETIPIVNEIPETVDQE